MPKFIECPQLTPINSFLSGCEVGDRIVNARLEAFSCKHTGTERRTARNIRTQLEEDRGIVEYAEGSASVLRIVTPLTKQYASKVVANLILTMNACFPDYDFSSSRADQFKLEELPLVMAAVNEQFAELELLYPGFCDNLWTAVDQVMTLKEVEVYSYVPDLDADPFSEGMMSSFNHFFFNKAANRILFFTCGFKSRFSSFSQEEEHYDDYEDYEGYEEKSEVGFDGDMDEGDNESLSDVEAEYTRNSRRSNSIDRIFAPNPFSSGAW